MKIELGKTYIDGYGNRHKMTHDLGLLHGFRAFATNDWITFAENGRSIFLGEFMPPGDNDIFDEAE